MSEIHKHRNTFYTVTCDLPYMLGDRVSHCNASQTYPSKREAEIAKRAHDKTFHDKVTTNG